MTAEPCIVCGNASAFSVFLNSSPHHPHYLKCDQCGLVFASPRRTFDYASPSRFKGWHADAFSVETRLANFEIRLSAIREHLNVAQARFLDVGAHDGVFLKLLSSKGLRGTGLEFNELAADYGRNQHGVDIETVPLERYKGEEKFDVITLFNVFEHLEDPVASLSEIRRLLKPGGIVALELPHVFTRQARVFGGRWHHFQPQHFWFYDQRTITQLLEAHGFTVSDCFFVPKIVNLSRPVWLLLAKLGFFRLFNDGRERFRQSSVFRYLDRKRVCLNLSEYLYVIAHRSAELQDPGAILNVGSDFGPTPRGQRKVRSEHAQSH